MKIQLENRHIISLIPFLQGMKLKGEQSRARSKFLNLAMDAYARLHESELELLKDYAVLDEDGEPVMAEDGSFTLKDGMSKEYLIEREKLFSEVAEIEGGTYASHLEAMRLILSEYAEELDGDVAALYDALLDAFEEAKDADGK